MGISRAFGPWAFFPNSTYLLEKERKNLNERLLLTLPRMRAPYSSEDTNSFTPSKIKNPSRHVRLDDVYLRLS